MPSSKVRLTKFGWRTALSATINLVDATVSSMYNASDWVMIHCTAVVLLTSKQLKLLRCKAHAVESCLASQALAGCKTWGNEAHRRLPDY